MARGRPAREAANAAEAAGRSAPAGSRTRTYRPTGQGRGTGFTGPPLPRRAGPEPVGRARHRHCSDASRAAAHQLASAGLTSREEGMIPADVLQSQCAGKWPPAAVTRAAAGTGDLTPSTWHAVELSRHRRFLRPVSRGLRTFGDAVPVLQVLHQVPSSASAEPLGLRTGTSWCTIRIGAGQGSWPHTWTARGVLATVKKSLDCLLYTSPSPRDGLLSRMPSSA